MLDSIWKYLGRSTINVLYYTDPFKYPLFDVRLHSYRFIMMQGGFNIPFLKFLFLFGFICCICYIYMYTTFNHVVYRYIHSIYCIHMCFTCLFYRICIH